MFKLFNKTKVFQVLFPREKIEENSTKLKLLGVSVFDLREADIRMIENWDVVDTIYILRCSATRSIIKLLKSIFTDELMYEGYRTFH